METSTGGGVKQTHRRDSAWCVWYFLTLLGLLKSSDGNILEVIKAQRLQFVCSLLCFYWFLLFQNNHYLMNRTKGFPAFGAWCSLISLFLLSVSIQPSVSQRTHRAVYSSEIKAVSLIQTSVCRVESLVLSHVHPYVVFLIWSSLNNGLFTHLQDRFTFLIVNTTLTWPYVHLKSFWSLNHSWSWYEALNKSL